MWGAVVRKARLGAWGLSARQGGCTGNLRSSCWPETPGSAQVGPSGLTLPLGGGGNQDSLVSQDRSIPQPSGPPPRPVPWGPLWLAAGQSAPSPGIRLLSLDPPDLTPSVHPEFMTKKDTQTNQVLEGSRKRRASAARAMPTDRQAGPEVLPGQGSTASTT